MEREVGREFFTSKMEASMRALGRRTRCTEREVFTTLTGRWPMTEAGTWIASTAKEESTTMPLSN